MATSSKQNDLAFLTTGLKPQTSVRTGLIFTVARDQVIESLCSLQPDIGSCCFVIELLDQERLSLVSATVVYMVHLLNPVLPHIKQ